MRSRSLYLRQRLVQRHAGTAGIGEDHLDPVVDQRFDENIGAALHLPGGAFGRVVVATMAGILIEICRMRRSR